VKIEPCRYCGNDRPAEYRDRLTPETFPFQIVCGKCGCRGPWARTMEEAIRRWNEVDAWTSIKDATPRSDGLYLVWRPSAAFVRRQSLALWDVSSLTWIDVITDREIQVAPVTHWHALPCAPLPEPNACRCGGCGWPDIADKLDWRYCPWCGKELKQ
jgi:hypothetical protein